jgi:glycosyltransferase involved in cell wall biosynthesis
MSQHAEPPILSVIIPVWNGARHLGETVSSVLGQEVENIEVLILVDDGSEDDSARVAQEFAAAPFVRCVEHPHMGLAAARNLGVSLARGGLLLHLDADDLLAPGSISTRLGVLSKNPDADIVTGSMVSFASPELSPEEAARYDIPAEPQKGGLPGTSIVRTAFVKKVGPQNTDLAHSADLDWMIRAGEAGAKTLTIPDVVLRRRIHGRNTSLASNATASRLQILRAAMARRAQAGTRP